MVVTSSGSSSSAVPLTSINDFTAPFSEDVNYQITSYQGYRNDPFNPSETKFHNGIDLYAPEGTDIVASAQGKVYEVGYSATGSGNYVYIEHDINGVKYYSIYAHMSDDSIVVHAGELVEKKQKIGVIGKTGMATGIHCHFTIATPKLIFDEEHLIDVNTLIDNDLYKRNHPDYFENNDPSDNDYFKNKSNSYVNN